MLMLLIWSPPFKGHGSRAPFESEAFSWIPISLVEALLFLGLDLGLNPSWQNQEDHDARIILIHLQDSCWFTVRPLLRHQPWRRLNSPYFLGHSDLRCCYYIRTCPRIGLNSLSSCPTHTQLSLSPLAPVMRSQSYVTKPIG